MSVVGAREVGAADRTAGHPGEEHVRRPGRASVETAWPPFDLSSDQVEPKPWSRNASLTPST